MRRTAAQQKARNNVKTAINVNTDQEAFDAAFLVSDLLDAFPEATEIKVSADFFDRYGPAIFSIRVKAPRLGSDWFFRLRDLWETWANRSAEWSAPVEVETGGGTHTLGTIDLFGVRWAAFVLREDKHGASLGFRGPQRKSPTIQNADYI